MNNNLNKLDEVELEKLIDTCERILSNKHFKDDLEYLESCRRDIIIAKDILARRNKLWAEVSALDFSRLCDVIRNLQSIDSKTLTADETYVLCAAAAARDELWRKDVYAMVPSLGT